MTTECRCGCGRVTRLFVKGEKKGQHKPFISGHEGRVTEEPVQEVVPEEGTCGCGCGAETSIAPETNASKGETKGQPRRYIRGHGSQPGPGPSATVFSKHTPEEVDRGLLALAVCGGSPTRAVRLLAGRMKITGATLTDWRLNLHAERYTELSNKHAREVEEVIVTEAREIAFQAAEVEKLGLEAIARHIRDGTLDPKDISSATRNASVTKGIATDTFLKLSGRPSLVVEHRSVEDLVRKLTDNFKIATVIDGTAEEIPALPAPDGVKADT